MKVRFNPGAAALHVAKVLKVELNIGLKEAKDMIDAKEFVCTKDQYEDLKDKLITCGADGFIATE